MRPRQKCLNCGASVDPDLVKYRKDRGWTILCKKCHKKELTQTHKRKREQTIAQRKQQFSKLRCKQCGGPIKWHDKYLKKSAAYWPLTCSPHCHGVYAKRNHRYSKQQLQEKVRHFITERGIWTPWGVVVKQLHITPKVLTKYRINVTALNKQILGLQYDRYSIDTVCGPFYTLQELQKRLSIKATSHKELLHKYKEINQPQKVIIQDILKSYIASKQRYTGVTALMRDMDVTFQFIRRKFKIDVIQLNAELGLRDTKRSWFQDIMYQALLQVLPREKISRQHSFASCRSSKNYALRFDFYIPDLKTLIEVDGQQHKHPTRSFSHCNSQDNDKRKDVWAKQQGFKLYRVPTVPKHTFQERAHKLVLDVVKPVELLEHQQDQKGVLLVNQQLSRERRQETESSETIEKGFTQMQLQF